MAGHAYIQRSFRHKVSACSRLFFVWHVTCTHQRVLRAGKPEPIRVCLSQLPAEATKHSVIHGGVSHIMRPRKQHPQQHLPLARSGLRSQVTQNIFCALHCKSRKYPKDRLKTNLLPCPHTAQGACQGDSVVSRHARDLRLACSQNTGRIQ